MVVPFGGGYELEAAGSFSYNRCADASQGEPTFVLGVLADVSGTILPLSTNIEAGLSVAMVGVADGDKAAYRLLMDRHLKRCIGLARRMTGNAADAEDVAQDAFLRLWRHADRWQPGRGKFSTWLYKIVVNLCIDRSRRRSFLPLEAAGDPADDRPDAAEGIAKAQTAKMIAAAIARLPERQRAALTLRYYEDIGNIEAAEILAVSVDAIESLLLRARRTLRAELAALAPSNAKEET